MKNTIKTILFSFLIIIISSCENDKEPIATANGFELRKDATIVSPAVLTESDNSTVFTKLEWDEANYGVETSATYKLYIFDKDNDPLLEKGIELDRSIGSVDNPNDRTASLTVEEINDMMNRLKTFKCSPMNIDIRIKSTLGSVTESSNPLEQFSKPVSYTITGYPKSLPILAFVKENETPLNAPKVAASAPGINTDYEGYMYLTPGNYKFYKPDACGDFTGAPAYGGSSGILNTDASAPSIVITTEGHYLVKANLSSTNLSYSLNRFRTFGVFGNGTRTGLGFANAVPMTYDATDKVWKLTVDLIKGNKFSFKSNLWTGEAVIPTTDNPPFIPAAGTTIISVLGKGINTNELINIPLIPNPTSGDISVPGSFDNFAKQKYNIELYVSNPRKYTYKMTAVN